MDLSFCSQIRASESISDLLDRVPEFARYKGLLKSNDGPFKDSKNTADMHALFVNIEFNKVEAMYEVKDPDDLVELAGFYSSIKKAVVE